MGLLSSIGKFATSAGGAALAGAGIDYFSAKDTQKKQKDMAREQMAFQERMSNTSYQRAVKDMRKANLNPMLAYQQGGASSPSGAQAQLKAPQVGSRVTEGLKASSAISLQKMQKDQVAANTDLLGAQTATAQQLARKESAEADLRQQEANFAKKYPDIYNAWKLGGWKAAAGQAATGTAKSLENFAREEIQETKEGVKQMFNFGPWLENEKRKASTKKRTRRGRR